MRVNKNACLCLLVALAIACTPRNVVSVNTGAGLLRLEVVSPEIVRVSAASDGKFSDRQSLAVLPQEGCTDFEVSEAMGVVHLATKDLAVGSSVLALKVKVKHLSKLLVWQGASPAAVGISVKEDSVALV